MYKQGITNTLALPIDKMLYMCIYVYIYKCIYYCAHDLFVCVCVYVHICVYTCVITLRLCSDYNLLQSHNRFYNFKLFVKLT